MRYAYTQSYKYDDILSNTNMMTWTNSIYNESKVVWRCKPWCKGHKHVLVICDQHVHLSRTVCGQRNLPPSIQSGIVDGSFWLVTHDVSSIPPWILVKEWLKTQPSTRCLPHLAPQPGRRGSIPRATWDPSVCHLDRSSKCPGEGRPLQNGEILRPSHCFLVGLASR